MDIIKKDGYALEHASDILKKDEEVVMEALRNAEWYDNQERLKLIQIKIS